MLEKYPFKIIQNTEESVILQNLVKTSLDVAMYPYVSSDIDYINITKGTDHVCTIIKADATTFSFSWGRSGHTIISNSLTILKNKIIEFITSQGILLDVMTTMQPDTLTIYYNTFFRSWQARLSKKGCKNEENLYIQNASSYAEVFEYVRNTFNSAFTKLNPAIASTGLNIWTSIADDSLDLAFVANCND